MNKVEGLQYLESTVQGRSSVRYVTKRIGKNEKSGAESGSNVVCFGDTEGNVGGRAGGCSG